MSDLIPRDAAKNTAKCAVHYLFDNFSPAAVDLFERPILDNPLGVFDAKLNPKR